MTMPAVPPSCQDIDIEKLFRALVAAGGNVGVAARKLGVPARDLRAMTRTNRRLLEGALEAEEQALDEAEAVLRAALRGPDMGKRLEAASHILKTNPAARRRGLGPPGDKTPQEPPQLVTLQWKGDK